MTTRPTLETTDPYEDPHRIAGLAESSAFDVPGAGTGSVRASSSPAPLLRTFAPAQIEQHFRRYQASGCKERLFRDLADHYVESLLSELQQLREVLEILGDENAQLTKRAARAEAVDVDAKVAAAEKALSDAVKRAQLRLNAEIAALTEDRDLLDWLEGQERDGLLWIHGPTGADGEWLVTRRRGVDHCARTLRDALRDALRAAGAAQEGR